MSGIEAGIAKISAYAADDRHGYELGSGSHPSYGPGTDCAGLARLYAAEVEGVPVESYPDFGTWNEKAVLTARGWTAIRFDASKMRRGDVLLRAKGDSTGHTVVYVGGWRIVGAEGNWDGKRGDGSAAEICERSYYDFDYDWILRPPAPAAGSGGASSEEAPKVDIEAVENGVYRLYNPYANRHHFTTDLSETKALVAEGWTYEGVKFRQGDGHQVHRLYNPHDGGHVFTAGVYEVGALVIAGWDYEGVGFLAGDSRELRRLYDASSGDHILCLADEAEAIAAKGWTDEGVLCMVD